MANKLKYGLKNVHYAKATIAQDGTATYDTPKAWPGAVNLSMDAQGSSTVFRADNMDYWTGESNNGYSGDFESALIPDSFREDILGEIKIGGKYVENAEAKTQPFALLFQFEGDVSNTRHVLYKCTCSRPSVSGKTTEEEFEPETETITITAGTIKNTALNKAITKVRCAEDDDNYATWFDAVWQPTSNTQQAATGGGTDPNGD